MMADKDLISRAAAMRAFAVKPGEYYHTSYIVGELNCLPAVDAAPVVRSCWKQTDAYPHWLYCLKCYKRIVPNAEWIEDYNVPTNYCPNCGAKMDGGESDERND